MVIQIQTRITTKKGTEEENQESQEPFTAVTNFAN